MSFSEGQSYSSFKSLEADIQLFEKQELVNLHKGHSHLLSTYKAKYLLEHNYNDELFYYNVKYI